MKTCTLYGFIAALGGAFLTLVLYFLGYHSTVEKLQAAKWPAGIVGLGIGGACAALGTKARREEVPVAEPFGYGSALWAAFLVGLIGSVFGALFNYCYYAFINPGISDIIFQESAAKLEASGVSGDRLDKIEAINRTFMTPPWETVFGFAASVVLALLIALILAAFLKRPTPPELRA
jgi:Protein of unknown function (DUF4199)